MAENSAMRPVIDCIDCGAPVERTFNEKDIGDRCGPCWNLFVCGDPVAQAEFCAGDPYYDCD